jgi:hypothetical protein
MQVVVELIGTLAACYVGSLFIVILLTKLINLIPPTHEHGKDHRPN